MADKAAHKFVVRFDGGSRGNPGPAGIGVVVEADGVPVVTLGRYIGQTTVNVAEYTALITGLEKAIELGAAEVAVFGDSELVVKQMNGQYRVKHPALIPLHAKARQLAGRFRRISIEHNRRESNALADALYNRALDSKGDVDDIDLPAATAPPPRAQPLQPLAPGQWKCGNCGCEVVVLRPSTGDGPFVCPCGRDMTLKR